MRIAQIAPLAESVPPRLYGGIERVVSYLTEELVRLGHDVTLFASGDSLTAASLVVCRPKALRLDPTVHDPMPHMIVLLERVRRQASEFDVLHFHIEYLHLPLFRGMAGRTLTTLHGRQDLDDIHGLYMEFDDMPLVSISDGQRTAMPHACWVGTVHHGVPGSLYRLHEKPGDYLAFLGRISPEKQPDHAIEIALRAGLPLKIAAKVDKADRDYFEARIRPMLDHPLIELVGEIGDGRKGDFLGNARALLFPIDWPEPFGMVMIEAMAAGTPVIAYPAGSVREVIDDGVTGFIVGGPDEAVAAVRRLGQLDRGLIRTVFDRRFSAERMARDYLDLYRQVMEGRLPGPVRPGRIVPEPMPKSLRRAASPR